MSRKGWFGVIVIGIASAILVEIVDRLIGFPESGITPWILLGIFWIVMLGWMWRERRQKAGHSEEGKT